MPVIHTMACFESVTCTSILITCKWIVLTCVLSITDSKKLEGGIYMVFEYMDHDLTGLADRPGVRFSIPQIKVYFFFLLVLSCCILLILHRISLILHRHCVPNNFATFPSSVLYEAVINWAPLLSC